MDSALRRVSRLAYTVYCKLQVVTIDRECLISEKQNNKARAEGARLPEKAMLLRDLFIFTKPSLDAFHSFGLISRACQRPRDIYIFLFSLILSVTFLFSVIFCVIS